MWSVPVPIPGNPLGYTLVYALESRRGIVLVDAGWQHAQSWDALTGGLRALGLDVADVYGVIVTHHHPDHSGLAGRVREASGAWIAMHAADVAVIRRFHRLQDDNGRLDWALVALRRAGASEEEINSAKGWDRHFDPPAIPDRELADGDLADVPGRTLRVVHTPGHSPGHICLHLPASQSADGGRLFTGDHVLPKITPHIGIYAFEAPDSNPLADFLGSLTRVAAIGASEALPAHEHRFTGISARAAAIKAHHEERLDEVIAILAAGAVRDAAGDGAAGATGGGAAGAVGHAAGDGVAGAVRDAAGDGAAGAAGHAAGGGVAGAAGDAAGGGAAGAVGHAVAHAAGDAATLSGSRSVTLWEIASRMRWNKSWLDMHPLLRRLAAGEAAAHLRLLERRGVARLVPGSDPLRYLAVSARPPRR